MTSTKPKTAHPYPFRKVRTPAESAIDEKTKRSGGITLKLLASDGDESSKANSHQRHRRRRNAAKAKKTRKKETANDVMLDAWKYAYERRDRRLTKP